MADFTMKLAEIHGEINKTNAIMSDKDGIIEITSLREFKLPNEYNSVIAYVGDVNSQIITFQLPESHEGHKLSECNYKKLKWKNLGNNIEGISELEIDAEDGKIASWVVPPEVFTSAGAIEISISIYDIKNGKIAFSWNTPTYKGLSVGEAFSKVGETINEELFPSKDEILFIDDETRAIVAPKGYNNVVCNFGDKYTSKIYFQVKRYINGIDVLGERTNIGVIIHFDAIDKSFAYPTDGDQLIIRKKNYAEGSVGDGLITLIWNLPPWLTNNNDSYMGSFSIALSFTSPISNEEQNQIEQEEFEEEPQEVEDIELKWTTSPYKNLIIGNVLPDEIAQASERPDIRADWDAQSGPNSISNKPLIKIGENKYATEIGVRTQAGCNAFKITYIEPYGYDSVDTAPTEMLLTLDSVQFLQNGDVCSIIVNSNYMNFGTIIAINGKTITVDNYPETLTAAILDRTTLRDPENTEKTKPYLFIADKQVVLIDEEEYPVGTVSIDNGQVAEGIDSKALLRASHAEGDATTAAGRYSHAEGNNTFAGYAAHAEGQNSKAIGNVSHAEGGQTTASGLYSHTEGQNSTASGNHSHAEGYQTTAEGNRAHAEGYKTSATGTDSHSEGNMTYAYGTASHAEGGGSTTANGDYSHAEGYSSKALKGYSHAEGYQSTAKGVASHSEGHKSVAHSKYAHAEGLETHAGDEGSEEQVAAEKDSGAHAEGRYTHANGQASHAEGNGTYATGPHSHAEGTNSQATFARAHAEGFGTMASADSAHAEGKDTISEGNYAHAEGEGTVAHSLSQHAQGRYNIIDTKGNNSSKGTYAHIVGNGTNKDNRSNAHTLDWSGNGWFAGELRIGGTSYENGSKLATEAYVVSMTNGGQGYYSVQEEILGTSETEHIVDYNKDKPFLQYACVIDCGDCTEITVTHTKTLRTGQDTSETIVVFEETTRLSPDQLPIKINTTDRYSCSLGGGSEAVWLSCKMSLNKNPLKIVFLAQ